METNMLKALLYELFFIDTTLFESLDDTNDYVQMLKEEHQERVNKIIDMLKEKES